MVSKAKLYSQLDRLQDELRERIIPHLEEAARGENGLVFCTTDFNPSGRTLKPDSETDELIQLGRHILGLAEKLGESSEGTVAERICWYCKKWSNSGFGDPKSAQKLAAEFLDEVIGTDSKA